MWFLSIHSESPKNILYIFISENRTNYLSMHSISHQYSLHFERTEFIFKTHISFPSRMRLCSYRTVTVRCTRSRVTARRASRTRCGSTCRPSPASAWRRSSWKTSSQPHRRTRPCCLCSLLRCVTFLLFTPQNKLTKIF